MRLICLHQSADLYGSDRSFLQVLEYFKKSGRFNEITVVVPRTGPLIEKLADLGVTIRIMDLSLLSKTYLKKLQWGKIIFPLLQFRKKKQLLESYDVIYANTSVILDFYALAPFIDRKKVIHIREIPVGWFSKVLTFLIQRANTLVLFNSESTKQGFGSFEKSAVVHNAFEGFPNLIISPETGNKYLRPLQILLIGRINDWKGQDFALEAIHQLNNPNVSLRIVGDTSAGNESRLDDLIAHAKMLGLSDRVEFYGFTNDPGQHYAWADVLIVPSKKPEPFGRIAIEAMSLGKPVIAANHGGLPEIIEHNHTGFLFTPNDINSFCKYLEQYLQHRDLVTEHGVNAKKTFTNKFSTSTMFERLDEIFHQYKI